MAGGRQSNKTNSEYDVSLDLPKDTDVGSGDCVGAVWALMSQKYILLPQLTAIVGFGTLLRLGLRPFVATQAAASDCARGTGHPNTDSAFGGASTRVALQPVAWENMHAT